MDALNELKGLSDASDIVINSGKNHDKRLAEWFKLVQEITTAIYKDEENIADTSDSKSANKTKIPGIVSFTTEDETINRKKQRISSTLAQMQKHRLSHAKKNSKTVSFQDLTIEASNKSLNQHEDAAFNSTFTKTSSSEHAIETPSNSNKRKSSQMLHDDKTEDYFTPPQSTHNVPQVHKEEAKAIEISDSKKRKSPPRPLSPIVIIKKVKLIQSKTPKPKASLRKSLRGQKGKTSESRLPKPISRLPSSKISSSGVNSSVLKENQTLQMKMASDKNQILKKIQADVKKKIQETKTKRDEKVQKTSYLHLKLEKEKQEKVKKHQEKKVEKALLKTVLDPKNKRLQEVSSISNSKVKNNSNSVEKISANNSGPPMKTPQKNDVKKINGEQTQNYEMTPVRSSYVNYDISEIKSDDSGDENETETNRKPIPNWASGVRLRNALVQQQYYPINTDELFGNIFETPNLCRIMGVPKKRYLKKRTSSAVWNSPSSFK